MGLRDYAAWHGDYDRPGSGLHLRLLVVQDLISGVLDEMPPGPIRVISMCAGQGRDLIGVARRHRRGGDLSGLLVEADPRNVDAARQAVDAAGLGEQLTVQRGDAGRSDAYAAAVPADIVLACGVFGNISDEHIRQTISFLPSLCARSARVLWTRWPEPDGIIEAIEGWFEEAGFKPYARVMPEVTMFCVGAARLTGAPQPFRPGAALFEFVR
jgi:hypothetical protein